MGVLGLDPRIITAISPILVTLTRVRVQLWAVAK
jgi:hypothetical protein